MIPNRVKYALRALLDLSLLNDGASTHAQAIAQRQSIPVKYLEQILRQLKQAGFLRGRSGPGGGYSLAFPAERINLYEVISQLEGATMRSCTDIASCGCSDVCAVQSVLIEAESAFFSVMGSLTLADLRSRHEKLHSIESVSWVI